MAATLYPGRWARDLLDRLGYRPTRENVTGLLAWQKAEGGHTANDSRWNPLNTTQPMPGATNTGTQGNIKQYRSYEQGMDATVKTLRNGRYGPILAALQAGTSAAAVTSAVAASPWGTGSLAGKALPWARETAAKHPGLWKEGGPKGDGTGHVDGPKGSGDKKPKPKPKGRGKGKGGGSGSRSNRVTLDLTELTAVISSLDRGAGQADTTVARVGRSVGALEQVLASATHHVLFTAAAASPSAAITVSPDFAAKVRQTVAPLTDPAGALKAVPRHLRWEAGLVRQVRWAATVADGGGSKADRRKVDQLLAALARGEKLPVSTRFALGLLLAGQLKVRHGGAKGGSGGAKKPTTTPSKPSKPSAGAKGGGVGRKALKVALTQKGVKETSTDWSPKINEYQKTTGAYRQAWCASFVNWSLRKAGKTVPGGGLAAVRTWVAKARAGQSGLKLVSAANARPGDLVAYDWGGGTDFGVDGHIGIVNSSVQGGRFTAIEGNTSSPGQVALRSRTTGVGNVVFIRVS